MKAQSLIQVTLIASLLLLSGLAIAGSTEFLVEMKIVDSGTQVAAPRMMVEENSESAMSISGENAVSVGLVVNSINEVHADVTAEIESGGASMSSKLGNL